MPHGKRAFEHFNDNVIQELSLLDPESFLYVGWRNGSNLWWKHHFSDRLNIKRVGIIDIYEPNYQQAKLTFPDCVSIHGDVREIEKHVFPGEYDIIFWDHGPEHVPTNDLVECTPRLFAYAGKALVYCCPWGKWPQGPEGGNAAEVHHDVDNKTLVDLGMKVTAFGSPGQDNNGELVAVMVHP